MHDLDIHGAASRVRGLLAIAVAGLCWTPSAGLAQPDGEPAAAPAAPAAPAVTAVTAVTADAADAADPTLDEPWALPPIEVEHPQVFNAATARLLPAGVLYAGFGLDSDGVPSSSAAIGLGDVAEFGVSFLDTIRARDTADAEPDNIQPYVAATFRMGVPEEFVFPYQPAVVLGFRKSFERSTDDFDTRVAELFLITSKRLGSSAQLHVGATLWDASLTYTGGGADGAPVLLHDRGVAKQVRGIFGFDARVKPNALVMVETYWAPEFRYDARKVALTAKFAFGVRYEVSDWMAIESGVAVPDIEARDLLQAKIFAQVRFISRRFARAYQRSR